jgi:AcrR family transcriptional regulator
MSKSGLFAHFRSKEEVQVELLDHVREFAARHTIEPAMAAPEGLPRLRALFTNWLGWAPRAGLPGGCPVAAAIFEVDDLEGAVREQVVAMEREWREFLTAHVLRAVELGHLRSDLDAAQLVWEMTGVYLAHHASSRFLRDPRADDRARVAFEALVARARP